MNHPAFPFPGPTLRDFALLAIAVVFVVIGLVIIPSNRDVGVMTLAFFGPCAVLFANTIIRKRRSRRPLPLKAEIIGSVPIRRSRFALLGTGSLLLGMGVTLILFGRAYGLVFWLLAWFIAFAGAAVVAGVALGLLGRDYIRFDPAGITFGYRRFSFTVPWDAIQSMRGGEYSSHAVLYIRINDDPPIAVTPPDMAPLAVKKLAYNLQWFGASVVIFPMHYYLDLPLLLLALNRYVEEPASRHELALGYIAQSA